MLMTAILFNNRNPTKASKDLQSHLLKLRQWLLDLKIRISPQKSNHITFTLNHLPVAIGSEILTQVNTVRYLSLHLDCRWIDLEGPYLY